jgi:threonine/homoserine/homoserine lactone efflux protein
MELQTWIYYLLTILVLTSTPGPNIFLALTTSISKGFKQSLYTVFGGLSATLIIMTLLTTSQNS